MDTLLQGLQDWFARHCDGGWEHDHGVAITTCDNPGWWVKIDLEGTELQGRPFDRIAENVDPVGVPQGDRWLDCHVEGGVWHGAGDETRLPVILRSFLEWADRREMWSG